MDCRSGTTGLGGLALGMVVLVACGCGGSRDAAGPSLEARYQNALQITNLETRARQLVLLAHDQQQAGDVLGSERSLAVAAEAGQQVEDAAARAAVLTVVASAQAQRGQSGSARQLLRLAHSAAEGLDDPLVQTPLITRMAEVHGLYLDNRDAAMIYLRQAEKLALAQGNPQVQVAATLSVAHAYYRLEAEQEAQRLVDHAYQTAEDIQDARMQADSLSDIGDKLYRMKDAQRAGRAWDQAQAAIGQIDDAISRAHALVHLAEKLATTDRKGTAGKLLEEAETLAYEGDLSMRESLLEAIRATRRRL